MKRILSRLGVIGLLIFMSTDLLIAAEEFEFSKTSYGDNIVNIPVVLKKAGQYYRQKPILSRYRLNDGNWIDFEENGIGWEEVDVKMYFFDIHKVELEGYENSIDIQLSFNGLDTLKGFSNINYCGPYVKITSVNANGEDMPVVNNQKLLVLNSNQNIYVRYEAYPFCIPDDALDHELSKVEYKINDSQWAWKADGEHTVIKKDSIIIESNVLQYGLNSIRFRAVGDNNDEISEEFIVYLYYFNFNVGELPSMVLCPVDEFYKLQPTPSGGYFSGNGMAGKSNAFNPLKAGPGKHTITYHMMIEGVEYTLDTEIEVIEEPELVVKGELQVCANQTDVVYYVLNPDSRFDYFWDVDNYQNITESDNGHSITVQWEKNIDLDEMTTGFVSVTSIPKETGTTCTQFADLIVDINPEVVPDKAELFFADDQNQLLVCTDTLSTYYKWYKNDKLIKETNSPYLFLDVPAISSEVFYVRTSFSTGNCFTQSFDCTIEDVAKSLKSIAFSDWNEELEEKGVFKVFPNPAEENTRLIIENELIGALTIKVVDISGKTMFSERALKDDPYFIYTINIESLHSGSYIIDVKMDNGYRNKQRIIKY